MPERIAPPSQNGESPIAEAMDMVITPIVAPVPNEVPVSTEIRQFNRNAISRNTDGSIRSAAQQTMTGIVPAPRQRAVIKPIRPKIIRIFFTVRTPSSDIRSSARGRCPRIRP